MIKAFLSHSSSDKGRYVRIVAEKIGLQYCVYDEYTFESGMRPIEEIIRGLNESQIFVVFLSEQALSSDWVRKEILLAYKKLTAQELRRIYPIIIDLNLTHEDPRIPQWMRDDYNLKYVSRPTVAARRIRQRLREISWSQNPRLKERDTIFVGRNTLISQIEERVDDFSQEFPICFVASGLPRIGRSTLLRRALIKCNIVRQSYDFPSIVLRREESLEDFLLKLYDLGFSRSEYPTGLMNLDKVERLNITEKIVRDIQIAQEIVLIHDEGCIIDHTREIKPWFDDILKRVAKEQKPTFLISSRNRPRLDLLHAKPYIFTLTVPELSFSERKGLFRRLIDLHGFALTREDFEFFIGLFQGFPDQAQFAFELIRDLGVQGARKESHQITEFNADKAATVLAKYSNRKDALDFLFLLAEFEFISLDFLFSLVSEAQYASLLEEFIATCICDHVGVEKEFIRLNDTIRDYVRRNRLEMPAQFKDKLAVHLDNFLQSADQEDRDVSDVLYSIKEGIKGGRMVPERYLIPSHFLRSIQELYQERGHLDRVIELADKLLEKEHLLDAAVAKDVRYYLCLSLARKRDNRMLSEVQKIHGPEHNFLLGFYYRLQGRAKDAIEQLNMCIDVPSVSARAKRELVQVLLSIEDYDAAASLARSNYEENRRNPYHIQAYFSTIVNSGHSKEKRELLINLEQELRSIGSDVSAEMANIARAEFLAKCENNYQAARDAINDTAQKYQDSPYPLLVKAFLAARNCDVEGLRSAYDRLQVMAKERTLSTDSLARLKSYLFVLLEGDVGKGLAYAEDNLRRYPQYSLQSFLDRLREVEANTRAKGQQGESAG